MHQGTQDSGRDSSERENQQGVWEVDMPGLWNSFVRQQSRSSQAYGLRPLECSDLCWQFHGVEGATPALSGLL